MRPLILLSGLAMGGAERVTVDLARRLGERGIAATIATLTDRHDGPLAAEVARLGIPRVDLGARRLADWRLPFRFARLLRSGRFDLVHAHGQDAAILTLTLAGLPLLRRVPVLVTRHVLDEPSGTRSERARRFLALAAFRCADLPVAVSAAAAERLERLARLKDHEVRVVPNGIDVEGIAAQATAAARDDVRREWRVPEDAPVALLAAVARPGKGHALLLEAWRRVQAELPEARLLLAGGGELLEAVRAQVEGAPELASCVHVLGGRDDVPRLLAACDVAVLPSESEALPTFVMEAAAAGRAVLATDVGGTRELVTDGVTGLLVPADPGPERLAAALLDLLRDPARASAMGRAAASRARKRFTLDVQADATLEAWRLAVLRAGGGA